MNILAIETSTDWCGIAFIQNGQCSHKIEQKIPRKHAEKLPLFYESLCDKINLNKIELDGIAVSIGPGSFTGLRVGLGFSKGLAFAKQLPIVPVPTLNVIAANSGIEKGEYSVLLYSHRDIVYGQNFSGSIPINEEEAKTWDSINRTGLIVQYGCEKIMVDENYSSVPPSAETTGLLAEKNFHEWVNKSPYDLVPNYISPFELGVKK